MWYDNTTTIAVTSRSSNTDSRRIHNRTIALLRLMHAGNQTIQGTSLCHMIQCLIPPLVHVFLSTDCRRLRSIRYTRFSQDLLWLEFSRRHGSLRPWLPPRILDANDLVLWSGDATYKHIVSTNSYLIVICFSYLEQPQYHSARQPATPSSS